MIITTPWRASRARQGGFTLVEVVISSTLAAFVLLAILTAFLFIGRSAANLRNYIDMETEARKALELFAQDTRQASAVSWGSASSVTLLVNDGTVTYAYANGTLTRTGGGTSARLITGITTFSFLAYTISGAAITDFSTNVARSSANFRTKQIQISLAAARTTQTVTTATNMVLSARYVLRNKFVTA
jgi:Tfp pilus assembly protein PilW